MGSSGFVLLLWLSQVTVAALPGHSAVTAWPRTGFRREYWRWGVAASDLQGLQGGGGRHAFTVSSFPLALFLRAQGTRIGWMDLEAGGARAKGDGKEAGRCEWATSHELGLLHSFLVRGRIPRRVAGYVRARATA